MKVKCIEGIFPIEQEVIGIAKIDEIRFEGLVRFNNNRMRLSFRYQLYLLHSLVFDNHSAIISKVLIY